MEYASRLPTRISSVIDSPWRLPRRSRSGTVSAPRPQLETAVEAAARGGSFGLEAVAEGSEAKEEGDPHGRNGYDGGGGQQHAFSTSQQPQKRASVGTQTSRAGSPASPAVDRMDEQRQEGHQTLAVRQLERDGPSQVVGLGKKRMKKWLVLVVPPDILPHSPPPLEASAFANGYGASGRYSGGILLPLQVTLSAQVSLVAREFALPSIAGVSLYLCLPGAPPAAAPLPYGENGYPFPAAAPPSTQAFAGLKPRLTDEAWMACFADFFDPEAHVEAMAGVGLLPIAARIEVDIDPRRARWLPAWSALPSMTPGSVQSAIAPRSPAFENPTPGRPRFGTSLSHNRPFTPSNASEAHLSELQTTDEEGEVAPSEAEETAQFLSSRHRSTSPAGPQTSTPLNSFTAAPRPLSLLSAQSSVYYRSQPSSPHFDSSSRSSSPLRLPDEPEPHVRAVRQPSHELVEKVVLEDSGFAEGWKDHDKADEWQPRGPHEYGESANPSTTPTQVLTPPTAVEAVTVEEDGHVFAFPRPPTPLLFSSPPSEKASTAAEPATDPDVSYDAEQHERSTEDWTAQLDRFREVSRTALVEGVEHPSEFGSFDATASYNELLRNIGQEEQEEERVVEEDASTGSVPRGSPQDQPEAAVLSPTSSSPPSFLAIDSPSLPPPTAPALSPSAPGYPYNLACLYPPGHDPIFHLLKAVPVVPIPPRHLYNLSPSLRSAYPNLQLYPPVYPDLRVYPSVPSAISLSTFLSASLRRSPRPPPLLLSPVEAAYHAIVDSWPPTPPSPERQPSATLEDRLSFSGEGEFVPLERQFEEDDSVEKAIPVKDEAREVGFNRRGSLIEADWAMKESGMRTLEEASQPSPVPVEMVPEDVDEASDDEFPMQRRQSTASLTLVEDDPFKPASTQSGEWTSDSEEGGDVVGDSSDEDDFLASYGAGRPLSAIVEESEVDVTAVSVAVAGPSEDRGFFGGLAGASSEEETEVEEDDQSPQALSVEPQGSPMLPAMSFHPPFEPPRIIYSAATASPATPSSPYSDEADPAPSSPLRSPHSSHSPLPSPTITPSRQFGATHECDAHLRSRSPTRELEEEEEEEEDDFAPASPSASTRLHYSTTTTTVTQEDDDYTLEIDDTRTSSYGGHGSGGGDEPYILSPGLQRALGLDNSPELAPVRFAADDELEMSDDGSEGSQYVVREEESCQTFDHLSPLPPVVAPEPVLFVFPPTDQSSDMIDAIAQFVCEAQTQSVERRGKFVVALSGYSPLPELLSQALVSDERIEFDKWEVFFTEETLVSSPPPTGPIPTGGGAPPSTLAAYTSFLSRVPIPSHRVHVLKTSLLDPPSPPTLVLGGQGQGHPPGEVCPHVAEKVAREYEGQVRRAFGLSEEETEVPRFDLVLLGIGEDGSCAGLHPHSSLLDDAPHPHRPLCLVPEPLIAPVLDSSTSSLTFTLPLLSSARRLAFLCTSPAISPPQHPSLAYAAALANLLDPSIAPEDARKVPAGRVRLGGGQPVIVFAEEEAARGVPEGEGRRMNFWEGGDEEEDEEEGGGGEGEEVGIIR